MSKNEKYTLDGVDGNAFAVMGYTAKAMRECGFKKQEIEIMQTLAMSKDYNNLLCICNDYIEQYNKISESENG